jgi:adenosine kinase
VGADFIGDRGWLDDHGVDTQSLYVSSTHHTARFVCTTDRDANQIASFYPGAMSEAREIALAPVVTRLGGIDLLVIGASDPDAMARHTREARALAIPFVADPSQQLSSLSGEQVIELVEGATYLFSNEYESALIERRTGWKSEDVLVRVGTRITTLGAEGAVVESAGEQPVEVAVPRELRIADPTGVGDAFRAGYLAGVCWGLSPERSAQLGCMMATLVVETIGTQEYELDPAAFVARFAEAYGHAASDEIARALRAVVE